jgi:FMN phosphatase YigB (HAD superfamily)
MKFGFAALRKKKASNDKVYELIAQFFGTEFYLDAHPELRDRDIDPIRHYISEGHDQGFDPARDFSTAAYRTRYPDVAQSGMNAYFHYLRFGRFENRVGSAFEASTNIIASEVTIPASSWVDPEPVEALQPQGEAPPKHQGPALDMLASRLSLQDAGRVAAMLNMNLGSLSPRSARVGLTSVLARNRQPEAPEEKRIEELVDGPMLAAQMAEAAEGKVLSLDVWDTLLRRDCAPDAIKLRHARVQWLTEVPPRSVHVNLHPVDLLQLRRMAEADVADEHFEYRISDVAEKLAPVLVDNLPSDSDAYVARFLEQEVSIESTSIKPDAVVANLLARHKGRKIVLSDFYMPGVALETLLAKAGFAKFDCVYSSSDYRATKRAGDLYDLVLAKEGLEPKDLLHVGDRFGADVVAARKRGLNAFHYFSPTHQPRLERLERDFWAHMGGDIEAYPNRLAAELGHRPGDPLKLELLAVPVTLFVLHVMEEALRRRVEVVHFMTREGVFFRKIYDLLCERDVFDVGSYPRSAILEVSRRATFAASLEDFTPTQLMRLWTQYSVQSLNALATTLNIDSAVWTRYAKKYGIDPEVAIQYPWQDAKLLRFMNDPRVLLVARDAIWQQREALMTYLEASGFEPGVDKDRLIVDIGWRGTIQDNLAQLVSGRIHGCYFGLNNYLNPQPANGSKTGYVFDVHLGFPLHLPEVAGLEFLFNAPGGSTLGYRDGKAIRDIIPEEEAVVTGPVAKMQDRLLKASAKVSDFIRRHGLVSIDLVSFAREVVAEFAYTPPAEVAEGFFDLSHNESFGVGSVHSMRFSSSELTGLVDCQGAHLHDQAARRLADLRWQGAVYQLPAFRKLTDRLTPSQRLHLPVAPALVRSSSLGKTSVAVLSPTPIRGSGGHRTIFNLSAALARAGYDVHLMHEQPADHATQEWIGSVLGDVSLTQHNGWDRSLNPAASVATIWHSARFQLEYWSSTAEHFYFVQDYESMFNPMGDAYLLASQSYTWGARHLCVGRWLAHELRSQFGLGVAAGGLGVDHKVYYARDKGERNANQIALLYQPEKYRRAPKICADALAIVKAELPDTKIVLYGSDARPSLPFDYEHLGLITDVNRINDLYNQSAVGLCISATNPSRIPFEMMASGCVPVDIYRANNLFDYDSGTGVLSHDAPESLAASLLRLLRDPENCAVRAAKSIESVRGRTLTWEMDVAVNAVGMGLKGFNFSQLDRPKPTYTDAPVLADVWQTDAVRQQMNYQAQQAGLENAF